MILLDYMMPRMNGLEVVKQLRATPEHQGIPVILLTAKASQEDKVAGLDAGADDYVTKPFDSFELLARVRAMMRLKEMHDTLAEWNRTLAETVKKQVSELERMARLKRYLSPQIAETILGQDDELFRTHRREITIVFLDLRGFTAFSDSAEPEEVMEFLRHYHAEMGQLVFKFEGTLERFMGDGIVIIFNDPIPCEDHAQQCHADGARDARSSERVAWCMVEERLELGFGRRHSRRLRDPRNHGIRRTHGLRHRRELTQSRSASLRRSQGRSNSHGSKNHEPAGTCVRGGGHRAA